MQKRRALIRAPQKRTLTQTQKPPHEAWQAFHLPLPHSTLRTPHSMNPLENRLHSQIRQFVVTITIGLSAGLAAVAFREGVFLLNAHIIQNPSEKGFFHLALYVIPTMFIGALLSGILMSKYARDAAGSGIPQVTLSYHRKQPDFSLNLIWVKFVGGILAIGTGSSLGREGPSIHIGAALASWISRIFGEAKEARENAICAGAAAGLAVAFNSPLAGVTLVLEEIARGRNQEKYSGRSLLAAALAVAVIHFLSGDRAALPIHYNLIPTTQSFFWAIAISFFSGLFGIVFQQTTLSLRGRMKSLPIPYALKPALGAFIASLVALVCFALTGSSGVFGLGETQIVTALNADTLWQTAIILALGKLLATVLCYATGGCGGIFAPILFFGGMSGVALASVLSQVLDLSSQEQTLLALAGITACLAAVVRAPLTSILIVAEMTRAFFAIPLLMVAAVIGAYMGKIFFRDGFYEAILRQDGSPI